MGQLGIRANCSPFQSLLIVVVVFLLSGCFSDIAQSKTISTPDPLTADERAWLTAQSTIRLSPNPDYQPIDFFDEQGQYQGITADYITLIEQRLGFRFQIVHVDITNEKLDFNNPAQLGADVKVAITQTPKRLENWLFTKPYLEIPAYIITRKGAGEALTLSQLDGNRIAVVWHYGARQYLADNYSKLVLDPVPNTRTGLRKVSFGLVDAFVSELPASTYWMEHEGITNLKVSGDSGYVYRLGIATRKDWPELNRILEKGLALITPEERTAIYRKWVKMPIEPSAFSRRLGQVLLGGLGVAGFGLLSVLWWNRSLSAQVRTRTAALQRELTERIQTEKELRISEERFATMFRFSPNPLAFARFSDGKILNVNDSWSQLTGYTKEELIGQRAIETKLWSEFDQREELVGLLKERHNLRDLEVSCRTKSGAQRTVLLSAEALQVNNERCYLWALQDLTERKQVEEQLRVSAQQLRQLAGYLQTIREEERTVIAREIHDELGQALTAMKMDLVWLTNHWPQASEALLARLAGLIDLTNNTINTVRKLATQLRPSILDNLGLTAAIEWQAQEFQTRTGVECELSAWPEEAELEPDQATALFRIFQETLTNVTRHSQATKVCVRLWQEPRRVTLEIKDNGRGITKDEILNSHSLGLRGMQERASLLGGEFNIKGEKNIGTIVTAWIPLQKSQAKGEGA